VAPPKKKPKAVLKPNSVLLAAVAKLASSQSKMLKTIGGLKAGRTPKAKPVKPPKKVSTATVTTTAAQAVRAPPSHGGCTHCKAKGFKGWEWHIKTKCYELVPAIRPADYVMRKDRP
jgi:hypothetical protein